MDGKFTPLDSVMTWIERAQRYQKVDVASWPIASCIALEPNVGFRGTAEVRVGTGQVTSWQTTTREDERAATVGPRERRRPTGVIITTKDKPSITVLT